MPSAPFAKLVAEHYALYGKAIKDAGIEIRG